MFKKDFNPDDITKDDMKLIAKNLKNFLMVHDEIMIIPEELLPKKDTIEDAKKTFKKLIKKLEKGDTSVFKDTEEWNNLL